MRQPSAHVRPLRQFPARRSHARIFGTVNLLPNLAPSWNVVPTQDAAVACRRPDTSARHLDLLKWGLLSYWAKEPTKALRPINARSETAAKSAMFKHAVARRRCLVSADAFYAWKAVEGGKQPYAIVRQDGQPIAFAGAVGRASTGPTRG
jgi:putative SOS response-associated peptidase YedK